MGALDTLLFSLAVVSSPVVGAEEAPSRYVEAQLKGQFKPFNTALIRSQRDKLAETKKDPHAQWDYPFLTVGFGRRRADDPFYHRFRVFAQSSQSQTSLGDPTARFLMRLWEILVGRVFHDHDSRILGGAVDVYLTKSGQAGGEQMFADDRQVGTILDPFSTNAQGKPMRVNVIYLYQVDQVVSPLERAREAAHEYGHATLPAIGPFTEPESWPNGDLGERLFLRWVRDGLAKGVIASEDAFGLKASDLDDYLAREYLPLVKLGAFDGPRASVLKGTGKEAFDAWVANALWLEAILPPFVLGRSFDQGAAEGGSAQDFPKGVVQGVEEFGKIELNLPSWAQGRRVWIPVGKMKIEGATVVNRLPSGWSQVQPTGKTIVLSGPGTRRAS